MISWERHFKNLYHISNPITLETNHISEVKSKNVLAIGRFHHQKGFDYLVRIWDKVAKQHPDWTLKIVGVVNKKRLLETLLKKMI
nr:glycosyltransferase [Soonwooa sp.]